MRRRDFALHSLAGPSIEQPPTSHRRAATRAARTVWLYGLTNRGRQERWRSRVDGRRNGRTARALFCSAIETGSEGTYHARAKSDPSELSYSEADLGVGTVIVLRRERRSANEN